MRKELTTSELQLDFILEEMICRAEMPLFKEKTIHYVHVGDIMYQNIEYLNKNGFSVTSLNSQKTQEIHEVQEAKDILQYLEENGFSITSLNSQKTQEIHEVQEAKDILDGLAVSVISIDWKYFQKVKQSLKLPSEEIMKEYPKSKHQFGCFWKYAELDF